MTKESSGSESAVEESSTKPKAEIGYAPEDYKEGTLVETKLPSGTWVLGAVQGIRPGGAGDAWDMKIPGQDLQGVPAKLVRRRLDEGESDWLVVERYKGLFGSGIYYRPTKNLKDITGSSQVAFNSIVVGREADGWVSTSHGYLPVMEDGVQVLAKRDRKGTVEISKEMRDWYLGAEEARRKAAMAKAALDPPPPQRFAVDEEVLFVTSDGKKHAAKVLSSAITSFSVLVRPAGGSEYTVARTMPTQLRKVLPNHTAIQGESPVCQKEGGCIHLTLRIENGKEHKMHPTQAALGMPIHFLMRSACSLIHSPPSCETRIALLLRGVPLRSSWRTMDAGLTNGTVVDVKLAPESVTPV